MSSLSKHTLCVLSFSPSATSTCSKSRIVRLWMSMLEWLCSSGTHAHFFFFFFLSTRSRLDSSHTRVNFGVCWWWGCLHSADLWSRRRCTSSAPKETEDSRMKGGVRQRKQEKEKEQRKCEVWRFVEVLKVLKMDYHSVVGSGTSNYWVTFVV